MTPRGLTFATLFLNPRAIRVSIPAFFATLLILLCCTRASADATSCAAQHCDATVLKLTLHDTVQPISAAYLERGLNYAAAHHYDAVLISLGTPGGLLTSTREMVSAIERSSVPVIVYVEPPGARAGSAGFFLLEAADVAAMAPGTNAGAAHPILEGATLDPILKKKVEEDASALIRSITTPRHRDDVAATAAVIDAKSYTADEALQHHLIDLVQPDEHALLTHLQDLSITRFNGATLKFRFAAPAIDPFPPSTRERLLTTLANPDLAILLLAMGMLLIYLEFNVPGTVVPGSFGVLFLALGLFGLNLLPIRHTAVALLLAAIALFVVEIKFTSHGVLSLAGTVCLVFGLMTLVDGPPELRVHTGVAIAAGLALALISFTLTRIALRARRNKSLVGAEAMRGLVAIATTPLAPTGQVEVRGEIWQAELAPGERPAALGDRMVITAVNGLTLDVRHSAPAPSPNGLD